MFPAKPAAHTCGITATWINHSTFLLQTTRGNILTGPVYGPRTSPVSWAGPRRTHAPGIAYHWSNHELSARNRRLWSGFFLETSEATAHFVGDTGYDSPKFGLIRARLGAPDLAMIPIGAYEPRWFMATHHCNPEEAVRIHYDLGSRLSIAIHGALFNSPTKPAKRRHRRWPLRSCIQTHRQAFFASSCRVKAP